MRPMLSGFFLAADSTGQAIVGAIRARQLSVARGAASTDNDGGHSHGPLA
jgi:hypothetical protein